MTTYTPGLRVSRRIRHRVRRILPIAGDVLVQRGEHVEAQMVVAQTFMPGDVTPVNLANALALAPADVKASLLKQAGERVAVGEILARTKGIFGLFKTEYCAKTAGTLESVSSITGQVILRGEPLPVQVRAYLTGTVVEVFPKEGVAVEADVTLVQGIFGVGGETYGPIVMAGNEPSADLTAADIRPDMKGAVVIGGGRMTEDAIRKGIDVGVSALVSGGIDDHDLRDVLGYDLGVAITGSEKIGLTLIVTEGFGTIAMADRTFRLLHSRAGAMAAVSGATQIRAGVMRPEIVIPIEKTDKTDSTAETHTGSKLELGGTVRVIRDPYFGRIGKVADLPSELRTLASGSQARVLEVVFESGERIVVPRANVELIET